MVAADLVQLALLLAAVVVLARPLGAYIVAVLEGRRTWATAALGPVEHGIYRASGIDPEREQSWRTYALSLLAFNFAGFLLLYAIMRLQGLLPLNPEGLRGVEWHTALNAAASFTTNTNWQSYGGETTLSYFSQAAGLTVQNFVSAATGIAVAAALIRGFARRRADAIGSFWVDLVRVTLYLLVPLSLTVSALLVWQGVPQNLDSYAEATTLEGAPQLIAQGPVASQESIKQLGTNGGGFFNANSAHPYENPNPLTDFIELVSMLAIPGALTYAFGRMVGDTRQGWAVLAAMVVLFVGAALLTTWAESQPNPALEGLGIEQSAGNLEGKETRFGVPGSALWGVVTTATSSGPVNAMHDSFNALSGAALLGLMQLGEVVFGGVGVGLTGMLLFAVLTVFLAGLMVGRTPELLGKKIEAYEIKMAVLPLLLFPVLLLGLTAIAVSGGWGTDSLNNQGPHGFSEILYAASSGAANNGSAFAGLNANTPFYNVAMSLVMLGGRFLLIVPTLALAGSLAAKQPVPPGPGTFPTTGPLWVVLLVSVVLIVGLLTFFPALALGPIAEHLLPAGATFGGAS
ncbi:MAG: potassium-transporting ATPase subunit KdpA [Dehalococcoidia bacterium]